MYEKRRYKNNVSEEKQYKELIRVMNWLKKDEFDYDKCLDYRKKVDELDKLKKDGTPYSCILQCLDIKLEMTELSEDTNNTTTLDEIDEYHQKLELIPDKIKRINTNEIKLDGGILNVKKEINVLKGMLVSNVEKLRERLSRKKSEPEEKARERKLQEQQQKVNGSSINTEQSSTEATGAILKRTKKHNVIKTKRRLKEHTTVLQRTKWQIFKIFGVIFISCCFISIILKLVIDQYQSIQNHEMVPSLNKLEEIIARDIVKLRSMVPPNQNNAKIISLQECEEITRCHSKLHIFSEECSDHQKIELLRGHGEQGCIGIVKKYSDKKLASYTNCIKYEVGSFQGIPSRDIIQKGEVFSIGKVGSYLENIGVTPSIEVIEEDCSIKCVKKNISQIIEIENCPSGQVCMTICINGVVVIPR
ncbi:hypothetical protein [Candidatus Mesenet endosymbiont of Agriotes lineatus]|uniref:hypothetical protein n=1 Tax=Candidatus Mesenet endosymbiont of Agriotes lineatus TaxID=3077948 RepID=UPI0030CFBA07